ncbi:helix-turn-helix transcriptional regulator [Nonomuraea fuscirosea]|uniref:helix-turn-helix transcriptional regulator n=1 Tax=Nonomuraea fuscirosea TaxID=1291556 RepID=UPI00343F7388
MAGGRAYGHAAGLPAVGEPSTLGPEPSIVGRDAEVGRLARVTGLGADVPSGDVLLGADAPHGGVRLGADEVGGGVLLVIGEPGVGKSTLLEDAARRAAHAGHRVLRATGRESERDLAFAGLHQLLRPVLDEADELPERQRLALLGAFGFEEASGEPLLTGLAVLTLLSRLAERTPVVLVVDDAQWIDAASAGVLSFVAWRLDDDPVALLVAVRDGEPLPGFDDAFPAITLEPLDDAASRRLLDLRAPELPTGIRDRVLAEAAGNPLALLELAKAAHSRGLDPQDHDHGPLPVGERLAAGYAAQVAELPEVCRRTLLLLAAADVADPPDAVLALLPDPDDKTWLTLEQAGLVGRAGRQVRFRHPLIRSAVYQSAPFDARAQAHRALAEVLGDEPDRRAWHLAAATPYPDAEVSAALERTADRARRRGGYAAAAQALARAAELSPVPGDGTRLLVDAAGLAVLTGRLAWVEELAERVRARTDDPTALAAATLRVGRLTALTRRHNAVFAELIGIAGDPAATHPSTALDALAAAAVLRFYSGDASHWQEIDRILPRLPDDPMRDWVRMVADPFGGGRGLAPRLPGLIAAARNHPERLTALAVAAWILDEIALAVRTFDEAVRSWRTRGPIPDGLAGVAALAYFEYGRWAQAREVCADIGALDAGKLDHAAACVLATDAMVLAAQGDTAEARALAERALRLVDPLESRSVAVHARRATAAAAAAEGDYESAYEQYRTLFDRGGDPVHYHASYPALPELAAAAARTGRHAEAAEIVERSARALAEGGSARLHALVERSRALLAAPERAERAFLAALAEPALEQRPFEHAQTRLEYAEWLRRRRRIAEARPHLAAAHDVFARLDARPWAERARAELRAAGTDVAVPDPHGLAELSPQQRQIVRLAARGLTNREIGERLFLSPRTVGSHLYRVFPKLGVTTRAQLRDVVDAGGVPRE